MQSPYRKSVRSMPGIIATVILLLVTMTSAAGPEPAPDFTLKSTSGGNLRLSEFRGEVVLLNFWASWCGPCRQEMPLLSELHEQYRDLGFTVLGVNVEQDNRKARKLLEDAPVSFPVLFDSDSIVSREYDVVAMPSTVLIDRNGKLRYLHKGYKPGLEAVYQQQVRDLLRE